MSIDTRPTRHRPTTSAETPRGPIGRIIAGSLAAGVLVTVALTLFVFAGGTESTVTGSALIAFGFGWLLIGVLTQRFTNQPQRWSFVPAAVMGATGAALLILAPGNDALTRLNWAWPPVVLAMAAWMFVQVRRSVPRGGRRMLMPVIAVLTLAPVGATYANLSAYGENEAAPGRTYDIGGHRLHLDCHGHGGPTAVLSNGMGEDSDSWNRIAGAVAGTTRVCAYDRAGQGRSESTASPQDGVAAAEDLHALLAAAGETGPYVLVGHSTGGTYALTYAARFPEQVAGLVLLDSSSPEQFTRMPAYPGQYAVMRRGFALMPTFSRLGLGASATAAGNVRDELSVIREVFDQAQQLTTFEGKPLAVVTASDSLQHTDGWAGAQDQLAALSTNRVHRVVHSTHAGLLEDREPAAAAARAITQVVSSVRTHAPLDPR